MTEKNYSDFQIDAFRELGNIGCGNAATALSKMLNRRIDINIPNIKIVPLEKFAGEIGGAETIMQCTYLKVTGDLKGEALLLFSERASLEMIDLMIGREKGTTKEMNEVDKSSLTEMSNIIVGSYLNSIANMLNLKLFPQPPLTANDMAQAVLDSILAEIGKSGDKILSIKTVINVEGHNINGIFIMLFEEESLELMLKKLNEMYELDIK